MPRLDILERKDDILQWIQEEQPKAYICKQLNCKQETLNKYLDLMKIEYKGQQSKKGQYKGGAEYKPALYYIENNIPIQSHKLKLKLFREGLKQEKCENCGISEWQGIKLPLELHHKDCNHYNNSLNNLQILCPNCHSIQEGNSGANVKKQAVVMEVVDNAHLECAADGRASSNLADSTNTNFCIDCGKKICYDSIRCKKCEGIRRHSNRIEREELKKLFRTVPFSQIGIQFGVSDNAIRKWCKNYNLPHKVSDIKLISDEDWELI